MITYVNTVFVSNGNNTSLATNINNIQKGQFIVYDVDNNKYSVDADTTRFQIGMGTGKTAKHVNYHTGNTTDVPMIKWSSIINVADIKSLSTLAYPGEDTEDEVTIDFTGLNSNLLATFAQGGKRIIVRLTFKDLPTRFRKWTESYEYVTNEGDTKATIAQNIANMINKEYKRARVIASVDSNKIVLKAMKYDDDDMVDSLNWANKGRFNVNVYYTDPAAEGWESTNKNFLKGVKISKKPGMTYAASAKLVRDREAQAMGYEGILNRGEGTWPIVKPAMETQLDGKYNAVTLEFENMYRAADDIFRKTKQAVEIYTTGSTDTIVNAISGIVSNNDRFHSDITTEKGNITNE